LLNVGGQTSTIQFIISVIPIDTFDRSDRLREGLCRVGSGTRGHWRLHGCADLVGCASQVLINLQNRLVLQFLSVRLIGRDNRYWVRRPMEPAHDRYRKYQTFQIA
jgi:hypothetical protein